MKSLSKLLLNLLISGLLILTTNTASAAVYSGKVTLVHLNGNAVYAGKRDMCIQMLPAIPGTWACIYSTNLVRTQAVTLLREAYELKKSCNVYTNGFGFDGAPAIETVECF